MSDKRTEAIKTLEDIIAMTDKFKEKGIRTGIFTVNSATIESLKFALESVKVDRAYDLAYEKVDFIEIPEGATNGELIKALFPNFEVKTREISSGIDNIVVCDNSFFGAINRFHTDWWNSPYRKEN